MAFRLLPLVVILLVGLVPVSAQSFDPNLWTLTEVGGTANPAAFENEYLAGLFEFTSGGAIGRETPAGATEDQFAFYHVAGDADGLTATRAEGVLRASNAIASSTLGQDRMVGFMARSNLSPGSPFVMLAGIPPNVSIETSPLSAFLVVREVQDGPVTYTDLGNNRIDERAVSVRYVNGIVETLGSRTPLAVSGPNVYVGFAIVNTTGRVSTGTAPIVGRRGVTAEWTQGFVGSPEGVPPTLAYFEEESWTLSGWGALDATSARHPIVYQEALPGQVVSITGTYSFLTSSRNGGLMIRSSLDPADPYVFLGNGTIQSRTVPGGPLTSERLTGAVRLTYNSDIDLVVARNFDGQIAWSLDADLGDTPVAGLVVTSSSLDPLSRQGTLRMEDVAVELSGSTDAPLPAAWEEGVVWVTPESYGSSLFSQSFANGTSDGLWSVRGAGDIWGDSDAFYSAYQTAPVGEPTALIEGRIKFVSSFFNWAKGGLMLRASQPQEVGDPKPFTDPGAPYAMVLRRPTGEYYVHARLTRGAETLIQSLSTTGTPLWTVRWEDGLATIAADGTEVWSTAIDLGDRPYAMLVSTASNYDGRENLATTSFSDVVAAFSRSDDPPQACTDPLAPWTSANVGLATSDPGAGATCLATGTTPESQVLEITGGGDIWGDYDRFQYVYRETSGADFDLRSTVSFMVGPNGPEGNEWAKTGLMVRESLAPDAPYAFIFVRNREFGGTWAHVRRTPGADPEFFRISDSRNLSAILSLVKRGDAISLVYPTQSGSSAAPKSYTTVLDLGSNPLVGIATTSTDPSLTGVLQETVASSIVYTPSVDQPIAGFLSEFVTTNGQDALYEGAVTPVNRPPFDYSVEAAGDLWGTTDQFQFVYQTLVGDGDVTIQTAAPVGVGGYTERWAKGGAMLRAPLRLDNGRLDPSAPYAMALTTTAAGIHTHARETIGGETTRPATFTSSTPELSHLLRLRRTGDHVQAYVNTSSTQRFVPFGEPMVLTGDSLHAGFALASTQADFSQPGSVQAFADIRVGPVPATAIAWTETFDGPERQATSSTGSRWWTDRRALASGARFDLSGDGALTIAQTGGTGRWRSAPLAADGGLDVELALRGSGTASPADRVRVLAFVDGQPRELATLTGAFGEETVTATGLDGASVELMIEATANGAVYAVESVTATPSAAVIVDAEPTGPIGPTRPLQLDAAPNPTRGRIALGITASEAGEVTVEIYDLLGRRQLVMEAPVPHGARTPIALDLGELASGIYVVRATTETGETATRRVTVVR